MIARRSTRPWSSPTSSRSFPVTRRGPSGSSSSASIGGAPPSGRAPSAWVGSHPVFSSTRRADTYPRRRVLPRTTRTSSLGDTSARKKAKSACGAISCSSWRDRRCAGDSRTPTPTRKRRHGRRSSARAPPVGERRVGAVRVGARYDVEAARVERVRHALVVAVAVEQPVEQVERSGRPGELDRMDLGMEKNRRLLLGRARLRFVTVASQMSRALVGAADGLEPGEAPGQ